jgi:hypothetical protein
LYRDRYAYARFLNRNLAALATTDLISPSGSMSRCALRGGFNKRSKTMRLMTITRVFAMSVVLLSGTAAYAAREPDHGAADICSEEHGVVCHTAPFTIEMPGANTVTQAPVGGGQARANARSKGWPGDMMLD